jgi:hypothetical protein
MERLRARSPRGSGGGAPGPVAAHPPLIVSGLMAEGITRQQIDVMGRETPGRLLMG